MEKKDIMNSRKAVIIFIMLSVVLLIGIGLLPKSSPTAAPTLSPAVAPATSNS